MAKLLADVHNTRLRYLGVIFTILVFGLAARLFYLQIIKHDYYVVASKAEQVKPLVIQAKRGLIYAMDGSEPVPMVINQSIYTMFADPAVVSDADDIVKVVTQVAKDKLRPNLDKLLHAPDSRYQILGTGLTRTQAEQIKKHSFKGIGFQEGTQRVYPENTLASQVLGFVNSSGEGQYGVEGQFNSKLTGENGLLKTVTDISGVPLTIGNDNINVPAHDGENIVLTVDRNIQSSAEKYLAKGMKRTGAKKGSVLIMDPQTGKVYAMASLPNYNPNKYNQVTEASLFQNPIISDPYEAGSVIKSFTVATGIDLGVITPSSKFYNYGYTQVDDATINNYDKSVMLGYQTMQTALTWSLNTGMIDIARQIGDGKNITKNARETIYDYFYNKFRLAQNTGVELAGENPGIMISPDTVQGNAVRYSNMVFGQGMDVTMLQVASAFGALVNGGIYHSPTVIEGIMNSDGRVVKSSSATNERVIKPSTAAQIKKMLEIDRHDNGAVDPSGYEMGGKTGTSQAIINGRYTFDETIGTYLGFGGNDAARYVIMVRLSGKNMTLQGARDAAPIFTDISNWLVRYLKVTPKG